MVTTIEVRISFDIYMPAYVSFSLVKFLRIKIVILECHAITSDTTPKFFSHFTLQFVADDSSP